MPGCYVCGPCKVSGLLSDMLYKKRMRGQVMSESSKNKTTLKPQERPVLKLVYDAEKEIEKTAGQPRRPTSRLVQLMTAYADSIDNDIRAILEY